MRLTQILVASSALLSGTLQAQNALDRPNRLETLTVTADPLALPEQELLQASEVLSDERLDDRRAATLGETAAGLLGVQSSYFGPGVGRPIVRGLDGPRVQILGEGISSLDVSTTSVDHAVSIDPFLADQIEVLKGPATLLYGTGAIGGVVNVRDGRIPDQAIDGTTGRAQVRVDSVDGSRSAVGRIDAGNGRFAAHADVSRRFGDSYSGPNDSEISNTQSDSTSAAVGIAYTGERGHAGIAVSDYRHTYGIPPESDDDTAPADFSARAKATGWSIRPKGAEGLVELDLDQRRVDFDSRLENPLPGWERFSARVGHNDYQHTEFVIDPQNGERSAGTRFFNDAVEARVEAIHAPISVWRGAIGLQGSRRDFEAIGDEAFVPPSLTKDLGLFVVERATMAPFTVEVGARVDRQTIEPEDGQQRRHHTFSISSTTRWEFAANWHASLHLDRAQRPPQAEELFSDGPHEATGSYEIGDAGLNRETANQIELGLHWHSEHAQARLLAFFNRFDDFIFLADTADERDDLPVRIWNQADAEFKGFEAEITTRLADSPTWGTWSLRGFADTVRARLREGNDLPRIVPGRLGASIDWAREGWRAGVDLVHYAKQDRTAPLESATASYTFLDARLVWRPSPGDWEFFAEGRNLTDREARVHSSPIKDRAPLPGRNFIAGIRYWF